MDQYEFTRARVVVCDAPEGVDDEVGWDSRKEQGNGIERQVVNRRMEKSRMINASTNFNRF